MVMIMKNKVIHSVYTELTLNDKNFNRIFSDHKCTSIRLGHKDFQQGSAYIKNDKTGQVLPINIWYVNHGILSDLGLNDARLDGFSTIEDLKSELCHCYQRSISDREIITQVHFDVVAEVVVA